MSMSDPVVLYANIGKLISEDWGRRTASVTVEAERVVKRAATRDSEGLHGAYDEASFMLLASIARDLKCMLDAADSTRRELANLRKDLRRVALAGEIRDKAIDLALSLARDPRPKITGAMLGGRCEDAHGLDLPPPTAERDDTKL